MSESYFLDEMWRGWSLATSIYARDEWRKWRNWNSQNHDVDRRETAMKFYVISREYCVLIVIMFGAFYSNKKVFLYFRREISLAVWRYEKSCLGHPNKKIYNNQSREGKRWRKNTQDIAEHMKEPRKSWVRDTTYKKSVNAMPPRVVSLFDSAKKRDRLDEILILIYLR